MAARLTFASRDARKIVARSGMLHGSENPVMMAARPTGTPMSTAVYTANVLTSARMAAGMTSRARRPLDEHPAG